MRKPVFFLGLLSLVLLPVSSHAQTVKECMWEHNKLQAWMDKQIDQDKYEHAQSLLVRAELYAGENNGEKCMEYVKEADGVAHSIVQN